MRLMGNNSGADSAQAAASRPRYASGQGEQGMNLDLVRSVRAHRKLALGVAAFVLVAILAWALGRRSVYSAESLVYIQPTAAKVLSDGTEAGYDASKYDSYVQQQVQTVTRYDILEDALSRLRKGVWRQPGESPQSAIARLRAALKVERVAESYQMSISLKGTDPEAITEVVNAVTDAYMAKSRKDELAQADRRLQALTQERDRIQAQLDADRAEQAGLSRSLGVANTAADTGNPYDAQLVALRDDLGKAREARDFAEVQLASVSKPEAQNSQALNAVADEMIANDPGLSSMKMAINQRLSLLNSQMTGLTPSHPLYKLDQEEIARLNQSLETMTAQLRAKAAEHLQQKLSVDLARSAGVEARLNAQLAQEVSAATGGATKLQRAAELAADIERQQARFASVDDMARSLEIENSSTGSAHISLPAMRPFAPDPSKRRLLVALALPLALLFGAGAAVAAKKLDQRVYVAKDLEDILNFPPMAVVPDSEDVSAATVEEYTLRLAAAIDHALRLGDARTFVFTAITVTSGIDGLVERLARKMEELGHRTSVMSASGALQRHAADDLPAGTLWNETLAGRSESGGKSDGARNNAVLDNIRRLKQENDLLLISAPPLLTSGEAEYLARFADATVLVAESAVTTRKELAEAAALLQRLNVPGAGVVLSNLRMRDADTLFKTSVRAFEERPRAEAMVMPAPARIGTYNGPDRRRTLRIDSGYSGAERRAAERHRAATEARAQESGAWGASSRRAREAEAGEPQTQLRTDRDERRRDGDISSAERRDAGESGTVFNGPDRRVHLPYHVYIGVERRALSAPASPHVGEQSGPRAASAPQANADTFPTEAVAPDPVRTPIQAEEAPLHAQPAPVQAAPTPIWAEAAPVLAERPAAQAEEAPIQQAPNAVRAEEAPVHDQPETRRANSEPMHTEAATVDVGSTPAIEEPAPSEPSQVPAFAQAQSGHLVDQARYAEPTPHAEPTRGVEPLRHAEPTRYIEPAFHAEPTAARAQSPASAVRADSGNGALNLGSANAENGHLPEPSAAMVAEAAVILEPENPSAIAREVLRNSALSAARASGSSIPAASAKDLLPSRNWHTENLDSANPDLPERDLPAAPAATFGAASPRHAPPVLEGASDRRSSSYSLFIAETFDALAAEYAAEEAAAAWTESVGGSSRFRVEKIREAFGSGVGASGGIREGDGGLSGSGGGEARQSGGVDPAPMKEEREADLPKRPAEENAESETQRARAELHRIAGTEDGTGTPHWSSADGSPLLGADDRSSRSNVIPLRGRSDAAMFGEQGGSGRFPQADAPRRAPQSDPELMAQAGARRSGWMRLIDSESRVMRAFTGESRDAGEDVATLPSRPGQYGRNRR